MSYGFLGRLVGCAVTISPFRITTLINSGQTEMTLMEAPISAICKLLLIYQRDVTTRHSLLRARLSITCEWAKAQKCHSVPSVPWRLEKIRLAKDLSRACKPGGNVKNS